ncbi:FAD-binding oxidoreductase [Xanthobacter sp. DSM 24535]|uniref:NAD(P)/FAD-dependent oxidoreductase n=1 Tax=Roseixanthobacter psychrophilus TaxID=3119917 RepID=UPI00372A0E6B
MSAIVRSTGPGIVAAELPSQPRGDLDCDVCIIGDGVPGLWIALVLALRGRAVVLLDTKAPEEGRHEAVVGAGLDLTATDLCERADRDRARALYDLSVGAARSAIRLLEVLGLEQTGEGQLLVPGPAGLSDLLDEAAARDVLGLSELSRVGETDLGDLLGTDAYAGALFDSHAWRFDVRSLGRLLGDAVAAAGVRRFVNAPVQGVDLDGVRKYIQLAGGRVRADHAVFSATRGLGRVAPWLARAIYPATFVTGTFDTGGVRLTEPGSSGLAVRETGARPARFLLDGSRITVTAPTATYQGREVAAACALRRQVGALYPGLARATVGAAFGWRAACAPAGLPVIGSYRPGVWYALALGQDPLANVSLAADLIGDAIVERDDRITLFGGPPLPSTWGVLGAGMRWSTYWAGRIADRSERRRARFADRQEVSMVEFSSA